MDTQKVVYNKKKNSPIPFYDVNENLRANWVHRATFGAGCITLLITLAKYISLLSSSFGVKYYYYYSILSSFMGYLAADLSVGIYHWAVDNYGNPENLVMGNQSADFLYHHEDPRAVTKSDISRKLFMASAAVIIIVTPINLMSNDPLVLAFLFVFAGLNMFGMEIHAWAHTPKRKLPWLVAVLQDLGVLITPAQHAPHHRPPHNVCYCSVSGALSWNRFIDSTGFFRVLELLIFKIFGVHPRSHVQARN